MSEPGGFVALPAATLEAAAAVVSNLAAAIRRPACIARPSRAGALAEEASRLKSRFLRRWVTSCGRR